VVIGDCEVCCGLNAIFMVKSVFLTDVWKEKLRDKRRMIDLVLEIQRIHHARMGMWVMFLCERIVTS